MAPALSVAVPVVPVELAPTSVWPPDTVVPPKTVWVIAVLEFTVMDNTPPPSVSAPLPNFVAVFVE